MSELTKKANQMDKEEKTKGIINDEGSTEEVGSSQDPPSDDEEITPQEEEGEEEQEQSLDLKEEQVDANDLFGLGELVGNVTTDQTGQLVLEMDWDKELVMLPDGILEQGIVLSSIRILHINMKSAIDLLRDGGEVMNGQPLNGICLESDGKRKVLLNGWVLYTAGVSTVWPP
jgi:hypothetical protein